MRKKKSISEFTIHRRHLPHWELPGSTYFVTFTLKDRTMCNLTRDDIAMLILNSIIFYANKRYYLYDHTIMLDHVHIILQPIENDGKVDPLGDIIGDIKQFTAHEINKKLRRKGSLWLDESYDRIIRNEKEFREKAKYIFDNPVKAGLIANGEDWKWWKAGIEPMGR
ncbi:MAG: transposase [Ignavibacteria bacterium]|nr:transposase [Ignavibacteria bacterium]MBI3766139.1 transposase [Ignavibacteriales bacterium]